MTNTDLVLLSATAVGGVFLGRIVVQQMFVEGLSKEERKNMLLLAASVGAWWGLNQLVHFGEYQKYLQVAP